MSSEAERVGMVAAKLSTLEKQLLLGQCSNWGSWMWDAGKYMCSLGLGTRNAGSIQFDTPLADEVKAYLQTPTPPSPEEE